MSQNNRINSADEWFVEGYSGDPIEVLEGSVVVKELSPENGFFRYALPPRCRDGARHRLHFRSSRNKRPLEGSPVNVQAIGESAQIPFHTSVYTGKKVLVLAPHPDDEALGCGGSLLLHRDAGDIVEVVFLTDGSGAGEPSLRETEARQACARLGVTGVRFWGCQDRRLAAEDPYVRQLERLLLEIEPELVYCPSPWEYHPDHKATWELLFRAVNSLQLDFEILLYEIGRPLPVNTLVNITSRNDELRTVYQAYESQLQRYPYHTLSDGLKHYRSHTVSNHGVTHCEGFFHTTARAMAGGGSKLLPLGAARIESISCAALVSVVVRTKNRPALLREALTSLAGQTYQNLEVIVVNDGGSEIKGILYDWEEHFQKTKLIHLSPGQGRSEAANRGMQEATGTYLALLDDDDLLDPFHIGKLVGFLEATGEQFAYSDCRQSVFAWNQDRFQEVKRTNPFHSRSFDRDELYFENFIPSMTALFHKELWNNAGPFDPGLSCLEDWDLWLRMSEHCRLCHLPGVTAHYRVFGERDYDFREATLTIYRKHDHYWNLENLARATWPGLKALRERHQECEQNLAEVQRKLQALEQEFHSLRGHAHCLESELAVHRRPLKEKIRDRIKSWLGLRP